MTGVPGGFELIVQLTEFTDRRAVDRLAVPKSRV